MKHGFLESFLNQDEQYDKFNLSNIFEYLNEKEFKAIAHQLEVSAKPNAKFVYWNLMVPRDLTTVSQIKASHTPNSQRDFGFFYNQYHYNKI